MISAFFAYASLSSATLFVFFATAAWAGIIAADGFRRGSSLRQSWTTRPKGAERANAAGWIIDAFFVWTAEDLFGDDGVCDVVVFQKGGEFVADGWIFANIALIGKPFAHGVQFEVVGGKD